MCYLEKIGLMTMIMFVPMLYMDVAPWKDNIASALVIVGTILFCSGDKITKIFNAIPRHD